MQRQFTTDPFELSNSMREKSNILLLMLFLGDIVRFSEEGRFDVFDRKKEIMKYNGYQVTVGR